MTAQSSPGMFPKEFSAIIRIMHDIDDRYRTAPRDLDDTLEKLSSCLSLFNKKYPAVRLSLEKKQAECRLGIGLKEESLKACYDGALSSLPGLTSLGKSSPSEIEAGNSEKVEALFGETVPQLIVLCRNQGLGDCVMTFREETGLVRVQYDPADLDDARTPLRQLVEKYARKESGEALDIFQGLRAIGFSKDIGDESDTAQSGIERLSEE